MRLQSELIKGQAFIFKNWVMAKRNIFTVFEILFWPVVNFFSVGLLTQFAALSPQMTAFVLVGIVSLSTVQVCQLDVAYVLLYDVWSKAVKHGFAAPVGIRHLFLGSLVVGMTRGSAVFFLLMGASYYFFGFDFTLPGAGPVLLFVSGLFLCAASVGLLVCILVLVFGNRADVAAWSLVSLMLLVCGIYYPISLLPSWVGNISAVIPLTYFLEYFRHFYGFPSNFSQIPVKGFALAFLYIVVEIILMKSAIRSAKKRGVLLKLSE
ncbi:MAG TPA: ABC transporter permease [Thermodesulfobacteriota bacterium]|nr:ABC transporter permease [Thermodesulfobacteriota bacterium]